MKPQLDLNTGTSAYVPPIPSDTSKNGAGSAQPDKQRSVSLGYSLNHQVSNPAARGRTMVDEDSAGQSGCDLNLRVSAFSVALQFREQKIEFVSVSDDVALLVDRDPTAPGTRRVVHALLWSS
jgi:hypothetical protein